MRCLIQRLTENVRHERGTTLVIGAGNGAELPLLRQLGGKRLILAEAHPHQAESLARRVDAAHGEEVWSMAITAAPADHATLYVINNPHHSSLKLPAGLSEHFPRLRVVQEMNVNARSLGEVIGSLAVETDAHNLLVLDAPGQAFELLSATPVQLLQSFSRIVVRCGVEPLYGDDKGVEELLALVRDIGFDVDKDDPEAIYPHTAVLLERNDARVDTRRLEVLLDQVSAECATQTRLASDWAQEVERLTRDGNRATMLAQDYKAELDTAAAAGKGQVDRLTQRNEELEKLAAEHQAQYQKLTQDRDAIARQLAESKGQLAESKSQLEAVNSSLSEQQKLATDRHTQIQTLTQERDAIAKQLAESKGQLEAANNSQAEQQKLATERYNQIQKLTQEREEQTKLAAQLKADLDKVSRQSQERGTLIVQLESGHAELNQRQARLNQEMVKAEAQIDLIKDVLLREPGL